MPTPLTYGTNVVNDGTGVPVPGGVETFTDPARSNAKGAVVAIRTADGQDLGMGQATRANSLPVTLPSDQTSIPITQPDPAKTTGTISAVDAASTSVTNSIGQTVVTGTATAGSSVSAALSGHATARIQLVSTNFTGTVVFERSFDGGTTWFAANVVAPGSTAATTVSSAVFTGAASTQLFEVNAAGVTNVRVRDTAAVTNSLAVTIQPGYGTGVITAASLASSAVIGKVGVDQTTPGTTNLVAAKTNSYRNGGVLHRTGITAIDKLIGGGTNGIPTTPTGTGVTVSGGSLASATAYSFAVVANNVYGNTLASATVQVTPGGSFNGVALTITPVTNATSYDLFCSSGTTTSMLWVGRITSAQLAAGNLQITTSGTIAAGASSANVINIACQGTGQAVNSQSFLANTAYQWSGITPIVCTGYSRANVYVQATLTDLRSAPSLVLAPAFQNQTDSNYYIGSLITVPLAGANGASLRQDFSIDVDGVTNLVMLTDTISGQGISVNIWMELM